ncbi:MAG: hypothetical protein HWQ38_20220 [Nostoc sp. NMS7]|uniref:hypothetical protein n=1 Tax=Nostoc sp. NMS7 TaxID=2815391 RepID=UPI0025EEB8BE|nr:hypothetical protein [Nostoc sp. NMS7]MBN3948654.1 hypothetical protein [Nostoc sp. NMS7]
MRIKSRNSLLFIVVGSFCISLLLALIHTAFTINIIISIFGLTSFLSGIFLYLRNQRIVKIQPRLAAIKQIIPTTNKQRTVNTNGGAYNEKIGRDYIGRDYVNKYINIKNEEVEISADISETLGDFKDILNEIIVKSSDPGQVISQFSQELAEELRKQPEVKASFNEKEDSSEQELANKIIIDLLTKSYDQLSQINQITQITRTDQINQSSQIQKLNNSSPLEYTYYIPDNDRDVILYNGYTIYLAKDHVNMWNLEIQREDGSPLDLIKRRRFSSKDNAIGTAKKKIDKDRITNWKSNINNPE